MYDIRFYRVTAVVTALLMVFANLFSVNDPKVRIETVTKAYFDSLMRMNLSDAIEYTTGQLKQNLTTYQSDVEQSAMRANYTGSLRDIRINIVELRDTYAKANVTVLSYIRTIEIPHSTYERHFEVEFVYTNKEWKIATSIQRSARIYDLN